MKLMYEWPASNAAMAYSELAGSIVAGTRPCAGDRPHGVCRDWTLRGLISRSNSAQLDGRFDASTAGSVEATLTTTRWASLSARTNSAMSRPSRAMAWRGVSSRGTSASAKRGDRLADAEDRARPDAAVDLVQFVAALLDNARQGGAAFVGHPQGLVDQRARRMSWPPTTSRSQSTSPSCRNCGNWLTRPMSPDESPLQGGQTKDCRRRHPPFGPINQTPTRESAMMVHCRASGGPRQYTIYHHAGPISFLNIKPIRG